MSEVRLISAEKTLIDIKDIVFKRRHGVKVEVDRVASGGRRVDETLRQPPTDIAVCMVVMGAYNHHGSGSGLMPPSARPVTVPC